MEENIRVRYSDKELEEFKAIIEEKIKKMVKFSEHKRNFAKGFRR